MRLTHHAPPPAPWVWLVFGAVAIVGNASAGLWLLAALAALWSGYLTIEAWRYHGGWRSSM